MKSKGSINDGGRDVKRAVNGYKLYKKTMPYVNVKDSETDIHYHTEL
jgi:hypothetical protein